MSGAVVRALRFASYSGAVVSIVALTACAPPASSPMPQWTEPATGMRFVQIPAGRFTMGSPEDEPGREPQERRHEVVLSRAFWLGAFEVTQGEWERVMGDTTTWFLDETGRRPVENVTWFEVERFLARLHAMSPTNEFRLPTEAEWEYACRAESTASYATGHAIGPAEANVAVSPERATEGMPRAVGSFPPNRWGLYDMHGNVWEWTSDEHCPYPEGTVTDPVQSCGQPLKIIRGGSFFFGADSARCALRYTHRPSDRGFSVGFRVVRQPVEP